MGLFLNTPLVPGANNFLELVIDGSVLQTVDGFLKKDLNVFHLQHLSGGGTRDKGHFLDAFDSAFTGTFLAAMPTSYTIDRYRARYLDDYTDAYTDKVMGSGGLVSTDRTTLFNAATVRLESGFRGRSYRGSKHFGPIPESHTTGDDLNATGLSAWGSVVTILNGFSGVVDADGNSWGIIIASTKNSVLGDEPSRILTYAELSEAVLNTEVGTMRHRKERQSGT
jgi:hypothetical protein